jgi:hypothetical protein
MYLARESTENHFDTTSISRVKKIVEWVIGRDFLSDI